MTESLEVISGLISQEVEAATFLARQGPLTEDVEVLIAKSLAAGIAQLREAQRQLLIIAITEEQRAAGVEV